MEQKEIKAMHKRLLDKRGVKNVDWEKDTLATIISELAIKPDKDLKDTVLNLMREREVNAYISDLMAKDLEASKDDVKTNTGINQDEKTEEKNNQIKGEM